MRHPRTAAFILVAWLFLVPTSPATLQAMAPPILRIELENFDQMQFYGRVSVGSPPQEFRVIFDTGSSDVWLADTHCDSCSAEARRYKASQSSTHAPTTDAFQLEYGSGTASGVLMRETLRLGGALEIANVQIGQVNTTTQRLRHFHADGIVGLGLESLAVITTPSLFATGQSTLLSTFSIFINSRPSSTPSSQLILGGVDSLIAQSVTADENPQWHYFPIIPYPEKKRLGFWAIRLREMTVSAQVAHGMDTSSIAVSGNATAIVDSGTSLILLPPRVFNATIDAISTHLRLKHGANLTRSSAAISGFSCKHCSPQMFPLVAFTIAATTFHLQGADYVRCDGAFCSPQLDSHTLFRPRKSSPSTHEDTEQVIVLGAIFLRTHYTNFDAHLRRVGFACAQRGCLGGHLPELRFHGGDVVGGSALHVAFWRRVHVAVGVMLVLLALLLASRPTHFQEQTRRKPTNGDCHGESEPDPEDEPWPRTAACQTQAVEDSLSQVSRRFGMELLRRLSSTLTTITVVGSSESESEKESAREPAHDATLRDEGANERRPHLLVVGKPTEHEQKRVGDANDEEALQNSLDECPARILALNPEAREATTRFRKGSVCLDA
jgi:cathepsin E